MSSRITKEQTARLTAAVRRQLVDDLVENPEAFLPALMGDLNHQIEILDFWNLSAENQAALLLELGFNPTHVWMKPVCAECGSDDVQVDGHATFDQDTGEWVLQGTRDDTYACNSDDCEGAECGVNWVVIPPKEEDGAT